MVKPIIAALLTLGVLAAAPQGAAAHEESKQPPRIHITGEGEVRVAPDMAIVNLTVMREAATAREALSANNAAMRQVIDAMKADGIADRDLQTSGINIRPRYQRPTKDNDLKEPKIVGYVVTNSVTVRVRDLNTVGAVLDRSVTLGVNQGGNLRFANHDTKAPMKEARKLAVADAIDRAKTLAEAAGVKLGRVVEMNEQSSIPRPMLMARQAMAAPAAAESVPIEAGENSYRAIVNLVFTIED